MSKHIVMWDFRGESATERKGAAAGQAHILWASAAEARACDILRSESPLVEWTMPVMPFSTPNSSPWMHEQYAPHPVHLQTRRELQGSASRVIAIEGYSPHHV
jgi:hypothetical protein